MKYITRVIENNNLKHIVEVNDKNVEVIQLGDSERYGNKKDHKVFIANGVKVAKDFTFLNASNNSDFIHLSKAVLAIELVRFVINHIGDKA